jgi:predicted membrane channel-forming protein YqfA (hemolysin III family)
VAGKFSDTGYGVVGKDPLNSAFLEGDTCCTAPTPSVAVRAARRAARGFQVSTTEPDGRFDSTLRRISSHLISSLAAAAATQALEAQAGSLSDRFVHLHETLSETLKHDAEAVNSLIQHVHTHLYPTELAARWPFYVFLVGAMVCLLASTVCHTMHCISQRFSSLIWRLDYVGIVALISCSYFPVIHYCFQCLPTIRAVYLGTVVVLASGCILVSSVEVFQVCASPAPSVRSILEIGTMRVTKVGDA